jgi:hypothetical protein
MSLDPLHRLLAINAILGAILGLAAVSVVFALDIGHLRALVFRDEISFAALALLAGGFVVTFSSVLMGTAIMGMRGPDDDDKGGHGNQLQPVRIRARR